MISKHGVARQVWSVVAVSIGAGVATLLVFGAVLQHTRLDREASSQHQARLTRAVLRAQQALPRGRAELDAALAGLSNPERPTGWLEEAALPANANLDPQGQFISQATRRALLADIKQLREVRDDVLAWSAHAEADERSEAEALRARVDTAFARARRSQAALLYETLASTQRLMSDAEAGFRRAWLVIVGVGLTAVSIVLIFARCIVRGVNAQMRLLSEKNDALSAANRRVAETLRSLRASEAWHDALIETTTDWVWEMDPSARFTYTSGHVEQLLGYERSEVVGCSPFDLMEPAEGARVRRIFEAHAAECAPFRALEHAMRHKDGREVIVAVSGVPIFSQSGEYRGYRGTVTDITQQRRADQELRSNEERLRAILRSVQSGIIIVDAESHEIVDANPAALQLFEVTREEAIGRPCFDHICRHAHGSCPIVDLGQTLDRDEREIVTKSGRIVPVLKTVTPITHNGRRLLVENFVDISDQKHAAEQMQRARRAAEDANRTKSEFLANMSHEIRTPMTAILGFADLLLDYCDDSQDARSAVETIRRNGKHLLSIINDILDISKIEAGKMQIEPERVSMWRVVEEVASLMRVRAADKGVEMKVRFDCPLPRFVYSDPVRLRQILLNLVGNAVKFTDEGFIEIVVRQDPKPDDKPRLLIDVIDTGIGIAADRLLHLFQPFTQADTSMARRFGGTGLGLTISRRLAKMLGGDISVRSELGVGTRFTVSIDPGPLDEADFVDSPEQAAAPAGDDSATPARAQVERAAPLRGRVLVAEDGPDNQRLIAHMLGKAGLDIDLAANGKIACDMVVEAQANGTAYDLVVMDMQMPQMDGYAATRELRNRQCSLPIIALTAHAMAGDREKCLAAGCDDYATKPIHWGTLLDLIRKHLQARARSAA